MRSHQVLRLHFLRNLYELDRLPNLQIQSLHLRLALPGVWNQGRPNTKPIARVNKLKALLLYGKAP
jgi:hypothetical protein